jgi:hypothetical protein
LARPRLICRIIHHEGTEFMEFDEILIEEIFSLRPPCLRGAISESLCLCEELLTTETRSSRTSK